MGAVREGVDVGREGAEEGRVGSDDEDRAEVVKSGWEESLGGGQELGRGEGQGRGARGEEGNVRSQRGGRGRVV